MQAIQSGSEAKLMLAGEHTTLVVLWVGGGGNG